MVSIDKREVELSIEGVKLSGCEIIPATSDKQGPWLVFLHEGLGSIAMWRDFPESLCAKTGLRGFVYERQGFGKSDPLQVVPRPIDYLQHEAQVVLPKVLEAVGITEPILVGHSDGGSIALIYAATYPRSVRGVISEAAHVFVEDVTIAGIEEAAAIYASTNLGEKLAKYHGDKTDATFKGWCDTWRLPAFRDWNIVEMLPSVVCPVLAIQGIDDEYGTPLQVKTIVEKVSGPAQPALIENCAHIPHFQARAAVEKVMCTFINDL